MLVRSRASVISLWNRNIKFGYTHYVRYSSNMNEKEKKQIEKEEENQIEKEKDYILDSTAVKEIGKDNVELEQIEKVDRQRGKELKDKIDSTERILKENGTNLLASFKKKIKTFTLKDIINNSRNLATRNRVKNGKLINLANNVINRSKVDKDAIKENLNEKYEAVKNTQKNIIKKLFISGAEKKEKIISNFLVVPKLVASKISEERKSINRKITIFFVVMSILVVIFGVDKMSDVALKIKRVLNEEE